MELFREDRGRVGGRQAEGRSRGTFCCACKKIPLSQWTKLSSKGNISTRCVTLTSLTQNKFIKLLTGRLTLVWQKGANCLERKRGRSHSDADLRQTMSNMPSSLWKESVQPTWNDQMSQRSKGFRVALWQCCSKVTVNRAVWTAKKRQVWCRKGSNVKLVCGKIWRGSSVQVLVN